ncbi:hypothetical protein BDM02DRAFT_1959327 [Thelephora ganbajun]|uniref:Uncharacterized protein n=1 Tax=Thelephora ganbajun TaxID=370292 RepID=A0ACB6ZHS9_THEGA|nr:hypothetical protein BDM02DRAFT_1959327 [Thelephora ganbajun]
MCWKEKVWVVEGLCTPFLVHQQHILVSLLWLWMIYLTTRRSFSANTSLTLHCILTVSFPEESLGCSTWMWWPYRTRRTPTMRCFSPQPEASNISRSSIYSVIKTSKCRQMSLVVSLTQETTKATDFEFVDYWDEGAIRDQPRVACMRDAEPRLRYFDSTRNSHTLKFVRIFTN